MYLLLVPCVFLMRMALNAIDGMMAREHNQATNLGLILNESGDIISDIALYTCFAFLPGLSLVLVCLIVLLAMLSEFVGVLGIAIGASRQYSGPMGKSDRALVFSIASIVLVAGSHQTFVTIMFAGMTLALMLTIYIRVQRALEEAKENN